MSPERPEAPPASLDDQPLNAGSEVEDLRTAEWGGDGEESSKTPWIVGALLLLLVVIAGLWWIRGRNVPPAPPAVGAAAPLPLESADAESEADLTADARDFGAVPELNYTDPWLRTVVGELSSHPKLAEWLLTDDLLRTGVKVVSNVAYGEDPRVHVGLLKPRGAFEVAGDVSSSRSFARYDLLGEVFASLDPEGLAELYREIAPRAQEAYEELGYPGSFDRALRDALTALDAVPVSDSPPKLVRETLSYRYADPELEALEPAQKLLLRMGPANQVKVQSQLDAVRKAMEM